VTKYGYNLSPEKIVETCVAKDIPVIAYTYNEPIIFFEYLYDCARLAAAKKIKNIFVSNGYESEEALEMMGTNLDAINIDLKAFSDRFYTKICKAKLRPVLDTITEIHQRNIWMEITTLVIPGENDSADELKDIASFIANIDPGIPWHISRFYPDYLMLDKQPTPETTLKKAYDIGKAAGLDYVYVGNLPGVDEANTYCPNCAQLLIRRSGYQIEIFESFKNGICQTCQTKVPGIWQ
jgi:pyruvate formate lyase activating enzyme